MRYFISLAYDGTAYHGWQVQPNGTSVQEVLEHALSTLLRQPVQVTAAGRTDAGVHAREMVAHFDLPAPDSLAAPLDGRQLTYKLNKLLPRDISIYNIVRVREDMHARFSAVRRTYPDCLHLQKNPFLRQYSWALYGTLDFERMNEAAAVLCEYDDFTSFSKVNTDVKRAMALHHHGQPFPAQYGACHRGHAHRGGTRPHVGGRVPASDRTT